MKRILSILGVVLLIGVIVGGVVAFQASRVVGEGDVGPRVLGSTQQTARSVVDSIQPAAQWVLGAVSTGASSVADAVLVDDQKIQVDKAFEDLKNNTANIPEHAFNEAKYAYCKQVVADYETTR